MNDRRILGMGEKDETIGRLLERTEQLMDQNKSFERTLGSFNSTIETFGRGVSKLEGAVQHLSDAITRQDLIDKRLSSCEAEVMDIKPKIASWVKVRDRVNYYLIAVAAAALLGGSAGGSFIKDIVEKLAK